MQLTSVAAETNLASNPMQSSYSALAFGVSYARQSAFDYSLL
jgi:hypothetical protein